MEVFRMSVLPYAKRNGDWSINFRIRKSCWRNHGSYNVNWKRGGPKAFPLGFFQQGNSLAALSQMSLMKHHQFQCTFQH